jgi:hypothetical protein
MIYKTPHRKSKIEQTRQSVQKSTNDRENKVTPPKHRDLKLNFEDFQQIDKHARKVKKGQTMIYKTPHRKSKIEKHEPD